MCEKKSHLGPVFYVQHVSSRCVHVELSPLTKKDTYYIIPTENYFKQILKALFDHILKNCMWIHKLHVITLRISYQESSDKIELLHVRMRKSMQPSRIDRLNAGKRVLK